MSVTARLVPDPSNLNEIPIKRFYLPFVLEDNCKVCGTVCRSDLGTDGSYLSYPSIGTPTRAWVYCEVCKKEQVVGLLLSFSITTCEPPPERVVYFVQRTVSNKGAFMTVLDTEKWEEALAAYTDLKIKGSGTKRILRAEGDDEKVMDVSGGADAG
jgi:hypothetical protein